MCRTGELYVAIQGEDERIRAEIKSAAHEFENEDERRFEAEIARITSASKRRLAAILHQLAACEQS